MWQPLLDSVSPTKNPNTPIRYIHLFSNELLLLNYYWSLNVNQLAYKTPKHLNKVSLVFGSKLCALLSLITIIRELLISRESQCDSLEWYFCQCHPLESWHEHSRNHLSGKVLIASRALSIAKDSAMYCGHQVVEAHSFCHVVDRAEPENWGFERDFWSVWVNC